MSMPAQPINTVVLLSPAHEKRLLWLLAFIQFTMIMDFMVMMPLGPMIMHAFTVGPAAFAAAVSAYSWCAGLSGLFAATYIDRFDRRRLLLTVYALFVMSNLACAMAPTFHVLLFARAFAGITGGVMGAVLLAIVGDTIPFERRGRAIGTLMTSFSFASVAGVPIGVALGAHWGWPSAFLLLVVFSTIMWFVALRLVPSLTAHLAKTPVPVSQVVPDLFALIFKLEHLRAFLMTAIVTATAMLVVPFISPMLVANQHIAITQIPWFYVAGGVASFLTARKIGALADRYGRVLVFRIMTLILIPFLYLLTHMPHLAFLAILPFFPAFMVLNQGRMISMQALMTTVPEPMHRGAFMSVNTSMQSLGLGVGAWVGGLLLDTAADGKILHYGTNGWVAIVLSLFALFWIGRVKPAAAAMAPPTIIPEPVVGESGA